MKNLTTAAIAAFVLAATANLAMAQDEDPLSSEPASEESWSSDSSGSDTAAAPVSTDSGSTADRTMGLSTTFPTGGDGGAANLLYGLDAETFLNIRFGFNFAKGEVPDPADPTMTSSETAIGIFAGAGYRMYKPTKGKIRPYLEPGAFIAISDFSEAGDTMSLGLNAVMGVDYALMDQFTLGMGIGGGISFSDSFESINLGLLTQSINATFWW